MKPKEQKNEMLYDALENADERYIAEMLDTDSPQALKKLESAEKQKEHAVRRRNILRAVLIPAACFSLIFAILLGVPGLRRTIFTGDTEPETVKTSDDAPDAQSKPSENTRPAQPSVSVDAFDKINYYTALAAIEESKKECAPAVRAKRHIPASALYVNDGDEPAENTAVCESTQDPPEYQSETLSSFEEIGTVCYEIEPDMRLNVRYAVHFKILLPEENSYLASKIGSGETEAVITVFDDECWFGSGVVTFRNGDRFCSFTTGSFAHAAAEGRRGVTYSFYVGCSFRGNMIVKDLSAPDYRYSIVFEDEKIVGIICNDNRPLDQNDKNIVILDGAEFSSEAYSVTLRELIVRYGFEEDLPELNVAEPVPAQQEDPSTQMIEEPTPTATAEPAAQTGPTEPTEPEEGIRALQEFGLALYEECWFKESFLEENRIALPGEEDQGLPTEIFYKIRNWSDFTHAFVWGTRISGDLSTETSVYYGFASNTTRRLVLEGAYLVGDTVEVYLTYAKPRKEDVDCAPYQRFARFILPFDFTFVRVYFDTEIPSDYPEFKKAEPAVYRADPYHAIPYDSSDTVSMFSEEFICEHHISLFAGDGLPEDYAQIVTSEEERAKVFRDGVFKDVDFSNRMLLIYTYKATDRLPIAEVDGDAGKNLKMCVVLEEENGVNEEPFQRYLVIELDRLESTNEGGFEQIVVYVSHEWTP